MLKEYWQNAIGNKVKSEFLFRIAFLWEFTVRGQIPFPVVTWLWYDIYHLLHGFDMEKSKFAMWNCRILQKMNVNVVFFWLRNQHISFVMYIAKIIVLEPKRIKVSFCMTFSSQNVLYTMKTLFVCGIEMILIVFPSHISLNKLSQWTAKNNKSFTMCVIQRTENNLERPNRIFIQIPLFYMNKGQKDKKYYLNSIKIQFCFC